MREVHRSQFRLGQVPIEKIWLNPKSRDDIPAVLKGLQHIWCDEEFRERLFALLDEHILPEADRTVCAARSRNCSTRCARRGGRSGIRSGWRRMFLSRPPRLPQQAPHRVPQQVDVGRRPTADNRWSAAGRWLSEQRKRSTRCGTRAWRNSPVAPSQALSLMRGGRLTRWSGVFCVVRRFLTRRRSFRSSRDTRAGFPKARRARRLNSEFLSPLSKTSMDSSFTTRFCGRVRMWTWRCRW